MGESTSKSILYTWRRGVFAKGVRYTSPWGSEILYVLKSLPNYIIQQSEH